MECDTGGSGRLVLVINDGDSYDANGAGTVDETTAYAIEEQVRGSWLRSAIFIPLAMSGGVRTSDLSLKSFT